MENKENLVDAESDVEICVDDDYDDGNDKMDIVENDKECSIKPEQISSEELNGENLDKEESCKEEIGASSFIEIEEDSELGALKISPIHSMDSESSQNNDHSKREFNLENDDVKKDVFSPSAKRFFMEDGANNRVDDENDESDDDEDDDYDDEGNGDVFNRFRFESDHLAFKHNKDYKNLLKSLIVLEAERIRAVKDLEDLQIWKEKAMKDPISFIESLQSKNPPKLPERRQVAGLPTIDWMQYLTSEDLLKYENGAQISTRRSFRTKGESSGQDDRAKSDSGTQDDNESVISDSSFDPTRFVRGRIRDESKVITFNRLWTNDEQEKLEKLLNIYPPEDVEARRWEKIARALGNRTAKQVSSRVQKYFIKLARAGLPIPGRIPHLTSQRKSKINPVSYRNSTFFPSWKPSVYMNDDDDDECSSVTTVQSDDTPYVSDEESISAELKDSIEYKELMNLKRLRRESKGMFQCSSCNIKPIQGPRWRCANCPDDSPIDLCGECAERNPQISSNTHSSWHRIVLVDKMSSFVDGDYVNFELQQGKYNYLDPNFIPNPR